MTLIEVNEGDRGYHITVTLYQNDDDTTVEDLTSATTMNLDITRKGENALVSNASVNIYDAVNGVVNFMPTATWFTRANLKGMSHYMCIFKITYGDGTKKSLSIPLYVHLGS